MSKDDGGPAFARADHNGDYQNWEGSAGMSLRDYFAAKAMQGLLANSGGPIQASSNHGWGLTNCTYADVADQAYIFADTMLKERAK